MKCAKCVYDKLMKMHLDGDKEDARLNMAALTCPDAFTVCNNHAVCLYHFRQQQGL